MCFRIWVSEIWSGSFPKVNHVILLSKAIHRLKFRRNVPIKFLNYPSKRTKTFTRRSGEKNKKISWCWQTCATQTKHGTIRYIRYGCLLVCYSNFVPLFLRYLTSKCKGKGTYTWYGASSWNTTSEAFRYDTCSQGISQFYLHTHTFIRNGNEPHLPLPSQL